MTIPDYQAVMLPLLRFVADEKEHSIGEVVEAVSREFALTEAERQQLVPSGQSTVIRNRAGWARTYLKKAGLIESTRRGFFRITERGRSVLAAKPGKIDVAFLEQFPEFIAFRELRHDREERTQDAAASVDETPEEALEGAYQRLRADLEAELLDQVKAASPAFFERLVVELLVRMGYGGTLRDAGQAIGRSGDGGIDGIIKKIASASTPSTSRRRSGSRRSGARRSRSSPARCRGIARGRASSSPPRRTPPMRSTTCRASTAGSS